MTEPCEYCGADDVPLYSWHADVWCLNCMLTIGANLPLALGPRDDHEDPYTRAELRFLPDDRRTT